MLGDQSNHDSSYSSAEDAEPHIGTQAEHACQSEGGGDIENGGTDGPEAERFGGIFSGHAAHDENAKDGAEQAHGSEQEGELHELEHSLLAGGGAELFHEGNGFCVRGFRRRPDTHRGCDGYRCDLCIAVRLEDVGAHPCDVAYIVAHVVGNDTGVAGVVLGDSSLHLAHQIRTDIGGLGENASPDPVEKSHKGRSHGESFHDFRDLLVILEDGKEAAQSDESHGGHGEPHHGTPEKGNGQSLGSSLVLCGEGRAHVGLRGGIHSDESGQGGREGSKEEGEGLLFAVGLFLEEEERAPDDQGEDGDEEKFSPHEHHCSPVDLFRDFSDLALAPGESDDAAE